MRKLLILILTLLIIIAAVYPADEGFSEFLFNEGDYYRCITQLKKEFYQSENPDTMRIYNLIGVNHYLMGEYDNALLYFSKIAPDRGDGLTNMLITLFRMKRFDAIDSIDVGNNEEAGRIQQIARLFAGRYSEEFIPGDSVLQDIFSDYHAIPKKNRLTAGMLSAIIPGLGRIYSGRTGDALFSFATVLLPAGAGYYYYAIDNDIGLYIAAGFAGLFYIGELYGAINSAGRYYPAHRDKYYEKITDNYSGSIFKPHYKFKSAASEAD